MRSINTCVGRPPAKTKDGFTNRELSDMATARGDRVFIGTPCNTCGNCKRRVHESRHVCVHCDITRATAYAKANPEKCKKAQKKWRDEHKGYLQLYRLTRKDL